VNPASAPQGSGATVTFRVTNTAPEAITRVTLVLPPDTPVAEAYPLSVADWAPQVTQRKLSRPLTTIHGGPPVSVTARDITWTAMPGRSLAPGRYADLSVALGPLPAVSRMSFVVRASYAGGAAPAMPPAVLSLTPAAAGRPPAHPGHGSLARTGPADAAVVAPGGRGPDRASIAGWIAAGLLTIGMVVAFPRSRWRRGDHGGAGDAVADEGQGPERERVAAGARPRPSPWRYRD
jgi:Domain of unkown function (DUF1775)